MMKTGVLVLATSITTTPREIGTVKYAIELATLQITDRIPWVFDATEGGRTQQVTLSCATRTYAHRKASGSVSVQKESAFIPSNRR